MKTLVMVILLVTGIFQESLGYAPNDSTLTNHSSPLYKGIHSLGGSISYNHSSFPESGETTTTIGISPTYLYFTSAAFAFGGQLLFLSIKNSDGSTQTTRSNFGIGPIARYYFFHDDPLVYVSASVFAQKSKITFETFSFESEYNSSVSVGLGVDFFLSNAISLEPVIQYHYSFQGGTANMRTFLIGISVMSFIK